MQEGLVDRILPWGGDIRGLPTADMDYYRGVVEGTQTELWPHLQLRAVARSTYIMTVAYSSPSWYQESGQ